MGTGARAAVIDIQVVSDNAELARAHQRKVAHYDNETIRQETQFKLCTSHPVQVSSATLNWRGCWAKESIKTLKELGLTDHQLAQVSIRVVENTNTILKVFQVTGRQGSTRPGRRTRPMTGPPALRKPDKAETWSPTSSWAINLERTAGVTPATVCVCPRLMCNMSVSK